MKTGINIWTLPWELGIDGAIREAARIGYDCIELTFNEEGPVSLESTEEELLGYRQTAQEAGIEIPSLSCGLYWLYSFTADDPAVRAKAMHIARAQIDAARVLGADTALMLPGAVYAPFNPDFQVVPYDIAYDRALEAMRELAVYAAEKQITIGLENVWSGFLLSPLEMRSFIDQVGSDYVRVYMDVGNILYIGYPEQWIRILGKRIARVHVKDFKKSVGTLNGFCELLEGDVAFDKVMQSLREIGYNGPLTAEITAAPGAAQRTYDALQKILAI